MKLQFGNQSKSYLDLLTRYSLNNVKSFAYEQITVDSSVQGLTIPEGAKYALLILESDAEGNVARILQNISVTIDANIGMPVPSGTVLEIFDYANLEGFRITEISSNQTLLNVEYFK